MLRYSTLAPSLLYVLRHRSIVILTASASSSSAVNASPTRQVSGAARHACAGGLRAAGVRLVDRVANRHGNSLEWCLGFWGSLMAGAVVVPVNTRFSEAEVSYVPPTPAPT